MTRGRFGRPQPPRVVLTPWKPDVCEEDDCEARHPAFSRDGGGGPWRCREHDSTATRRPEDLSAPRPMPKRQDSLL